jgi:hypothetical protein
MKACKYGYNRDPPYENEAFNLPIRLSRASFMPIPLKIFI